MADTGIDPAVLKNALKEIARALESLEQSIRSGARFRASDIKIILDALNELVKDIEKGE